MHRCFCFFIFFFNDTATTEIYTLSLHDALPISPGALVPRDPLVGRLAVCPWRDRKSTRLNSSHANISYAVFCLKKKKKLSEGIVAIVMPETQSLFSVRAALS